MFLILVLVTITIHGKGGGHLIKIEREYHGFESDIVGQKDQPAVPRIGGKGFKEFWCGLFRYR